MTVVDTIGTTSAVPDGTTADSTLTALSGLGSDGFLQLLIAQLRYQNPLQPSDPTEMMMQTMQLAQLDFTQQLLAVQRRDLGLQQAVAAAGLVGSTVTGVVADGGVIHGVVDAVRYTGAGPVLVIGEVELPFDSITEVHRGEVAEAAEVEVVDETEEADDAEETDEVAEVDEPPESADAGGAEESTEEADATTGTAPTEPEESEPTDPTDETEPTDQSDDTEPTDPTDDTDQ